MNTFTLGVYHRLPPRLRSVAASAHGLALRRWRYGPETERLVAEAFARERWSAERWTRWREERLARVLHRAATRVPYYRELWEQRRRRGDRSSWERLEHWPVLDKETIRSAPLRLVADDCDVSRMYSEHTSGTSGTPLCLWWSRATVRQWYALLEARCRRWHGVSRLDRWAILGGKLVVPPAERRPPFWVWNAGLNQLYMSSFHLAPQLIPSYVEALERHRITYLWGYSSALYELANGILQHGRPDDLRLRVVITNAEPLRPYQRRAIREAFGCEVKETYGMAEIVAAGSECERGQLHEWPEIGWLEVLEHDVPVLPGMAGQLVATSLLNEDMPLIRYRVGDRIGTSPRSEPCLCGRTLPTLAAIEGRADDVLTLADGRRLVRLDVVFKSDLPIREAQIVQESVARIRIRYVPAPGADTVTVPRALLEAARAHLGQVEIVLEPLDRIPRGPNGKFRAVVSEVPAEAHARASG